MGRSSSTVVAVVAVVAAGAVGLVLTAACSSRGAAVDEATTPFPDREGADAGVAARDASDEAADDSVDSVELDGSTEDATADDAGDVAVDAGPCSGKPDGYAYKPGDAQARCCGGKTARTDSTSNCGGCGIKCAAGRACGQLVPGHYACKCTTNAECVSDGYGSIATCYLGGGGYCNCQCPSNASTCKGECGGGATCHVVAGNNYCAY